MISASSPIGVVVVSIRHHKELLVILTPQGEIRIELKSLSGTRVKAVIRAPKDLKILREKIVIPDLEVAPCADRG
jgi:sRNA-binding carbon storage regulator CsrA